MKRVFDELQFDDRSTDDLFITDKSHEPGYADILKRWSDGYRLSVSEQMIAVRILILYPGYIEDKHNAEEVIEILRVCLLQQELLNSSNPERGLVLYILFFLLIKKGKNEEASVLLDLISEFFCTYEKEIGSALTPQKSITRDEFSIELRNHAFSIFPPGFEDAYTEILALIMDSREILSLKPGFNISQLPVPVRLKLSASEGTNYRGQALEYYYLEAYEKAAAVYREMLINKFESPGTLAHLSRLELISGNIVQAEIFIANAWRIRNEAPVYVLVRLLYFIILIDMERSHPYEKWLACLKHVLNKPESKMEWDMDRVLTMFEKSILPDDMRILKVLLEFISGKTDDGELNRIECWLKAIPVEMEEWPDFSEL